MEPLYIKSSELAGRFFITSASYVHPLPSLYIVLDWGGQSDFQILSLEISTVGSEGHPPPSSSLPGRTVGGMGMEGTNLGWRGQS